MTVLSSTGEVVGGEDSKSALALSDNFCGKVWGCVDITGVNML